MVDTLAPKRVFTQRELDNKLVPVEDQIKKTKPRESFIADVSKTVPSMAADTSLIDKITKDVNTKQAKDIATAEQEQTIKSSQETLATKQTGEQVTKDVPQGLVARPVEYAAKGFDDKEISGPIIVGEIGPEMIVPTGDGKISILPTKIVEGLMVKPLKEAKKGMYDVKYAQEGMDNIDLGATETRLGNPAGNPRHQSNIMNKAQYYTDQARQENKSHIYGGLASGASNYGTEPEEEGEANKRWMYGKLISKNEPNQHRDEFQTLNIIYRDLTSGFMEHDDEGNLYANAGAVLDNNFDEVIQPVLYNHPSLGDNIPQNLEFNDISSSIRDSYKHGYIGGYYNLVQGEANAKDFGSYHGEYMSSKFTTTDHQGYGILTPRGGTWSGNPGDITDRDIEHIKETMMDVNNNMMGNSIANEVRKELGLGTGKLKGKDLEKAEALFQEKYTKAYFSDLSAYAAGDNRIPEYETIPSNEEIKERIYGEDGGAIKNRLNTLIESVIGAREDAVDSSGRNKLILKFPDEMYDRMHRENLPARRPWTPPGAVARGSTAEGGWRDGLGDRTAGQATRYTPPGKS